MSKHSKEYLERVTGILNWIETVQNENLAAVAEHMAETIENGRSIFVFGPGHAGIFTQDMYHRAGGFILVNPILHPGTLVSNRPITTTSELEKLPGSGRLVLNSAPIKSGDMLIIHSVAGRIPIVTEMAVEARNRGIYVAGIINMAFASHVTSYDPEGHMLYDVCDIMIDEGGEFGDASILLDGMKQKVAATSTISSSFIGHTLEIMTCEILLKKGIEPPVVCSTNVEGGDTQNQRLMKQYQDCIHYL